MLTPQLKAYDNLVTDILRNISLNQNDFHNGILTEDFFDRDDVAENKKEQLKNLTKMLGIKDV
jgi:hypothetical protein